MYIGLAEWQNSRTLIVSICFITDAESHILFFDIEGLIFELHSEEYAAMSPTTLEVCIVLYKWRPHVDLMRI